MFEYVQERETSSHLTPRTMVYVITTGEKDNEDLEKLSERGENQVVEIALSRVVAGVRKIYSASSKISMSTSKILAEEFSAKIEKKGCLDDVNIGKKFDLREAILEMWKDEEHEPDGGESFALARERFGECMNEIEENPKKGNYVSEEEDTEALKKGHFRNEKMKTKLY